MLYCLNPSCPHPQNPESNVHCQYCGAPLILRNRFKASQLLGEGGFGTTYLAQDLDNRGKPCVIKRFSYKSSNRQAANRAEHLFAQEAERLDSLIHPRIPRLLGYFQEGNHLYLIQEFIKGRTLRAELETAGPFNESQVRAVLCDLLPVLQYVHSRDIIHRDIKPDNIIRRESGELVLIDFGIAKLIDRSPETQIMEIRSGTIIGTHGFSAPEQISGTVTFASDIFALGATCFDLLTQASSAGVMTLNYENWVASWQQYVKQPLSDELSAVISRMIVVDVRSRYPSAIAVLQDLGRRASSGAFAPTPAFSSSNAAAPNAAAPNAAAPNAAVPNATERRRSSKITTLVASRVPAARSPMSTTSGFRARPPQKGPFAPSSHTTIESVAVSKQFCFDYALSSYIGQVIGLFAGAICAFLLMSQFHDNPQEEIGILFSLILAMYLAVGTIFVGFAQHLALRQWLPRSIVWLPATVIGYWVALGLFLVVSYLALDEYVALSIAVTTMGFLSGISLGALQQIALRRHTPRARWWIVWTTVMLICLHAVVFSLSFPITLAWFLLSPLLDGLFLSWILRRRKVRREVATV